METRVLPELSSRRIATGPGFNQGVWVIPNPSRYSMDSTLLEQQVNNGAGLPSRTSKEISNLLKDSVEGQINLNDLLSMPTMFASGELSVQTQRGSLLVYTPVAPAAMEKSTQSRIAYLSRLFTYWRGDIQFRIIVTKSKFQEVKLLLVFVPGITVAHFRELSLEQLVSYQCSKIVGTSTDTELVLDVPYLAPTMWSKVGESIGVFGVVLFDRMISVTDLDSPISWSLFVSSPRGESQMTFRNAIPPPLRAITGGSASSNNYADSVGNIVSNVYTRTPGQKTRAIDWTLGVGTYDNARSYSERPNGGYPGLVYTAMPIRVLGRNPELLARKLSTLGFAPPSSYQIGATMGFKSLVPYLPVITRIYSPLPNVEQGYGKSYDAWLCNCNNRLENNALFFGHDPFGMWFIIGMEDENLAASFDGWRVIGAWVSDQGNNELCFFKATQQNKTQLKLTVTQYCGETGHFPGVGGLGIHHGSPILWIDAPNSVTKDRASYGVEKWIAGQIRIAQSRKLADYVMVYSDAVRSARDAIMDWLNADTDEAPPKLAYGHLLTFSLAQNSMFIERQQRGPLMWLWNLFGGDRQSTLGKIVRVADVIFDFFLPMIVGFDGHARHFELSDIRCEYVPNASLEELAEFRNKALYVTDDPIEESPHNQIILNPEDLDQKQETEPAPTSRLKKLAKAVTGHAPRSPERETSRRRSHGRSADGKVVGNLERKGK